MPIYTFRCEECEAGKEVLVHKFEDLKVPECSRCESIMVRNFRVDAPRVHADSYRKAIHSDSLALMPNQVADHRQMFPDIEIDKECRPVFDNYQKHDKYLNQIGAVKNPGKNKRKSTKVK